MKYQIKLEIFEGPFDLLFHLIEKNEVDIYNIPIAEITQQYLDYLGEMQSMDLDIASEFLVMAATLLSIKAKMLLPKPQKVLEEEVLDEDPRDELVERLLEYKKYKIIAEYLHQQEESQGRIFCRPNEEEFFLSMFASKNPLEGVRIEDLTAALTLILSRNLDVEPIREIHREEITIKKKMEEILTILQSYPHGLSFFDLFSVSVSKIEVVVQFLALLELIRMQSIKVRQPSVNGDIMIFAY